MTYPRWGGSVHDGTPNLCARVRKQGSAYHPSNRRLRQVQRALGDCPVGKLLGPGLVPSARPRRGGVNSGSKNAFPWLERRGAGRADNPLLLAQPVSSGQGVTAAVGGTNEKLMSTAWAELTQALAET